MNSKSSDTSDPDLGILTQGPGVRKDNVYKTQLVCLSTCYLVFSGALHASYDANILAFLVLNTDLTNHEQTTTSPHRLR